MFLAQGPQRSDAGEAPTQWVSVSGWHDCRKHSENVALVCWIFHTIKKIDTTSTLVESV